MKQYIVNEDALLNVINFLANVKTSEVKYITIDNIIKSLQNSQEYIKDKDTKK